MDYNKQHIAIIGLGLIGGSIALRLQQTKLAKNIIGVDTSKEHQTKAIELNLVHEILPLQEAITKAEVIILAIPVNAATDLITNILAQLTPKQIIIDVGSTKNNICVAASKEHNRAQFVATHPMWGTEYTGPAAAQSNSFTGKACVICESELSNSTAVQWVENMYNSFGMHLLYMNAAAHDLHVAYISHISHITSFALANTVLEKEKEDKTIFELASGGFESTVRLAKSNAAMWMPIFQQNKENVLDVLNEHIIQLKKFKSCLEKENFEYLQDLMLNANKIKRILP
jgi:prephenate dehydrogenase